MALQEFVQSSQLSHPLNQSLAGNYLLEDLRDCELCRQQLQDACSPNLSIWQAFESWDHCWYADRLNLSFAHYSYSCRYCFGMCLGRYWSSLPHWPTSSRYLALASLFPLFYPVGIWVVRLLDQILEVACPSSRPIAFAKWAALFLPASFENLWISSSVESRLLIWWTCWWGIN